MKIAHDSNVPSSAQTTEQLEIPLGELAPDPDNRPIDEAGEEFLSLVDSARVLGILQPLHVQRRTDGTLLLIDGERRWRAAKAIGLARVPCVVWSEGTPQKQTLVAGLVLNEHRTAHGPIQTARRLRQIKNTYGLTGEDLSKQTGLPLDRVKSYLALFGASDFLLSFFEQSEVPLRVAAEMMRYERATNEARSRTLVERYRESPLSRQEIVALRRRAEGAGAGKKPTGETPAKAPTSLVGVRFKSAFERNREAALRELEAFLATLGFQIVADPSFAPADPRQLPLHP